MKRCAWFLTDLRIGGGEKLPLVLLPEMANFDGTVVLFKREVRQDVPAGVRIIALGMGGRLMTRLPWLIAAALRASRGADLLVGGLEGAPIVVAAICGWLSGRPAVGVVPTHLGRLLEAVRMGGMERRLLGWALRRCRALITASADGRDALIEGGVPAGRVHVIPNPVSPWAFSAAERASTGRTIPRVLTVGRLEPAKGVDVILEAARRLSDVPFEWEIVGDGSQAAPLRARNAELGLEDKVRFTGPVEDLGPHLARADLFVIGSRIEGMSIAMLEAMASGIPVVATRSGRGAEEALAQGEAGVLVPTEDPDALARAVRDLLQDPVRARALGDRGRRRAHDFAPARIAAAYAGVFTAVLESA